MNERRYVTGGWHESLSPWDFRQQCQPSVRGYGGPFWEIVDAIWTPAEQNNLAWLWKALS